MLLAIPDGFPFADHPPAIEDHDVILVLLQQFDRLVRVAVEHAQFDALAEMGFELRGLAVIEKRIPIAFGIAFEHGEEIGLLSEFVEQIDFVWGGVVEKPKDFHQKVFYLKTEDRYRWKW